MAGLLIRVGLLLHPFSTTDQRKGIGSMFLATFGNPHIGWSWGDRTFYAAAPIGDLTDLMEGIRNFQTLCDNESVYVHISDSNVLLAPFVVDGHLDFNYDQDPSNVTEFIMDFANSVPSDHPTLNFQLE